MTGTAPLTLGGQALVRAVAALALGGEVSTGASVYVPLDLEGRVLLRGGRALTLAGRIFASVRLPLCLSGRTVQRGARTLGLGGRVGGKVALILPLSGLVAGGEPVLRHLKLTGEVKDYTLPPTAPVSAYRTRLALTAQERLRSLT